MGKNWEEKVFEDIPVGSEEAALLVGFLKAHDFAAGTRKGIVLDLRKLAKWFTEANKEPFNVARVTTRDITDFRDYLRREKGQAVATVNRTLVMVRRFFAWLVEQGHVRANPAKPVKELKRQQLAPKGLDRSQVRNNGNDLVGLAQILGHENLNTTARYTKRTGEQLADAAEKLNY